MATDTGDSLVRERPKSTILADIKAARGGQEAAKPAGQTDGDVVERSDPLPRPGTPYAAHARKVVQPLMTLFLVDKDYLPDGFAYADLRRCRLVASEQPGMGPVLVLRFTHAEVRVEGRKLFLLCYEIGMHQMPWIWEHPSPGDFKDDDATLIRRITVKMDA